MKVVYWLLILLISASPIAAQQVSTSCDTIVVVKPKAVNKTVKRTTIKRKSTYIKKKSVQKSISSKKLSCNTDTLSHEGILVPTDTTTDPNWEINPQVIGAYRKTLSVKEVFATPISNTTADSVTKSCNSYEYNGNFGTKDFNDNHHTACKSSGNILAPVAFFVGAVVFFISGDDDDFGQDDNPLTCKNPHHHHGHRH